ncbi:hypothetical protein ACFL4O_04100, partial [bacterium]
QLNFKNIIIQANIISRYIYETFRNFIRHEKILNSFDNIGRVLNEIELHKEERIKTEEAIDEHGEIDRAIYRYKIPKTVAKIYIRRIEYLIPLSGILGLIGLCREKAKNILILPPVNYMSLDNWAELLKEFKDMTNRILKKQAKFFVYRKQIKKDLIIYEIENIIKYTLRNKQNTDNDGININTSKAIGYSV